MDPPAAPEKRDPLCREEAEELVDELAFAERTESEIRGALGRAELGDALGEEKFTEVMTRARAARERVPRPLGKVLPRVVGVVAVLLGTAVFWVTAGSKVEMPHPRGYGPQGWALLAIVLGLVLLIKPGWRDEKF